MAQPDLNQLLVLDVLLTEGSVARAAARLHLSPSAMSRALARLRSTMGDPLLVRAGRGLVPTPRALALRAQVSSLVEQALAVLRPDQVPDLGQLRRIFTVRTREGFVDNFGALLIARVQAEAPGVQLCFVQKTDRASTALREGSVDLDIGVAGAMTGPEVRTRALFRDRFIGVVRAGHALAKGRVTEKRFAAGAHVAVARKLPGGAQLHVVSVVGDFSTALALARGSDLIATVPERYTGRLREGMHSFALPVPLADMTISMLWHPRMDGDAAHRWLRALLLEVCADPA